jgi:fructose-1,6-bisphosphatase/inositol monophosphatase family enzyme
MQQTADFFTAAQACIEKVVRDYRTTILEAHGKIDPSIKPDATPVTEFDKELEQKLRDALTAFDSSIGFEGEELGKSGNDNTFWLIDPIDGTESFVRGLPFVRNIVTLISNNKPVFTLVYRPIADELFIASEGNGATKNGIALQVSPRSLERTWIDISAPVTAPGSDALLKTLKPYINGFRIMGEFTYVVEGKVDAHLLYKAGGGPWDYAPRALLFKEAGGKVANLGTDTYDFRNNNVLMANEVVFNELMDLITQSLQNHN